EDINELEKINGRVSSVVAPLIKFFANTNRDVFGIQGAPLHDALAVSYLIDPTILSVKKLHVDIETLGEFTRGRTVVDFYGVTRKAPNANVALDLNLDKFKALLFKAIKYFDEAS
ncbi:MAG: nucleoside hydrolase, partial [Caldisericaceae bacterium]